MICTHLINDLRNQPNSCREDECPRVTLFWNEGHRDYKEGVKTCSCKLPEAQTNHKDGMQS